MTQGGGANVGVGVTACRGLMHKLLVPLLRHHIPPKPARHHHHLLRLCLCLEKRHVVVRVELRGCLGGGAQKRVASRGLGRGRAPRPGPRGEDVARLRLTLFVGDHGKVDLLAASEPGRKGLQDEYVFAVHLLCLRAVNESVILHLLDDAREGAFAEDPAGLARAAHHGTNSSVSRTSSIH